MENFPGNSRRPLSHVPSGQTTPPAEDKKFEPVVTGKVIHRKKPLGRRLRDLFFAGEGGVLSYLTQEVLIPAIRDTVADFVIQGIEKAAYGRVISPRRTSPTFRGSTPTRPPISYNRPSTIVRSPLNPSVPAPIRQQLTQVSPLNLEEVIVPTQFEGEIIFEKLYEAIEEYGAATVAHFKELLGETAVYTDHKWGWTAEDSEFSIRRVREGFLLIIPNPVDLR